MSSIILTGKKNTLDNFHNIAIMSTSERYSLYFKGDELRQLTVRISGRRVTLSGVVMSIEKDRKIHIYRRSERMMPEATRTLRRRNCFYRSVTIKSVCLYGNIYCWLFKTMESCFFMVFFIFLPVNSISDTPGRELYKSY